MDIRRQEDKLLHYWNIIRHALLGMVILALVMFVVFVLPSVDRDRNDQNGVDRRNRTRDTIECESKGGLMGQGTCFDVDSIIPLVGAREKYKD